MTLRRKLALTSAALLAVMAAAAYTLLASRTPDSLSGASSSESVMTSSESAWPETSPYHLRDVRPGAMDTTRRRVQENALTDSASLRKVARPTISPSLSASVPSVSAPVAFSLAAPPRERRDPREIYAGPPSSRDTKPAAPHPSTGNDHHIGPALTAPATMAASPSPALTKNYSPAKSAPASHGEAVVDEAAASIAPSTPVAPDQPTPRSTSTVHQDAIMPPGPVMEEPPTRPQGRAVLSTEMQRLRAQLGWRAFDQWVRTQAASGEE